MFLHLSDDAQKPDIEVAALLEAVSPRHLLRMALPDAPPRLFKALDRVGDQVRSRSFYERLGAACRTHVADAILASGDLDEARLDWAERMMNLEPDLLGLPEIVKRSAHQVEAINAVVLFLRSHDAFESDDLRLPSDAGLRAVLGRLQIAMDRVTAPEPPFAVGSPFRIIRSGRELREAGTRLQNCVRSIKGPGGEHWFCLANGSSVYVTSDEPDLLAEVRNVGRDLWTICENHCRRDRRLGPNTRRLLEDSLQSAGVRLLTTSPETALSSLGYAMERDIGVDFADLLEAADPEAELQD